MTNDNVTKAPVYRYITTNLRTDEVLAEIPFQGVSYGRTLKSSGSFSGNIPVIDQTESMNLFESTMPGKTALYVLRDGECVWGGIVWDSQYNGETKTLNVAASEFPSYFNRRVIWRDFDLSHKATVVVDATTDRGEIRITDGSHTDGFVPTAELHLEFTNEMHKGYSGFYRIAPGSSPTLTSASILRTYGHDVVDMVHRDGLLDLHTRDDHHWKVGDTISLRADDDFTEAEGVVGDWKVVSVDKLDSTRIVLSGPPGSTEFPSWNEGDLLVWRGIPAGTYDNVTVTTHANTYDFVRYLIESTMTDFSTGVFHETRDSFLGVRGFLDVDQVESGPGTDGLPGWARFRTTSPVSFIPGQTVQVRGVGFGYDGDHFVARILDTHTFEVLGWNFPANLLAVGTREVKFATVRIDGSREREIQGLPKILGEVTVTTTTPHNMRVGDTIEVSSSASDNRSAREAFNGSYQITQVLGPNELSYGIYTDVDDLPTTELVPPTITWFGDSYPIISVQNNGTETIISYSGSGTIPNGATGAIFSDLDISLPIQDITYDKQQGRVWVETTTAHPFATNDSIEISGAQARHRIWSVSAVDPNVAEVFFVDALNFTAGDVVNFEGVLDTTRIEAREGVAGQVQLTLDRLPWFTSDKTVTIQDLKDTLTITETRMSPGRVEFISTSPTHTIPVGAKLEISMPYGRIIQSFQIENSQAIFRTNSPHNFVAGAKARIDACPDMPGLVGDYTIRRVGDLEIWVSLDKVEDESLKESRHVPQTPLSGTWMSSDKHPGSDGAEVVEVTATSVVVSSPQARNEEYLADRTNSTVTGLSFLNGQHTISAIAGRVVTLATEYPVGNHAKYTYPTPKDYEQNQVYDFAHNHVGRMRAPSMLNGAKTVVSRPNMYTVRVQAALPIEEGLSNRSLQTGAATLPSRFNGSHIITVHSPTEFWWPSTAYEYSMSERGAGISARASLPLSALLGGSVIAADTVKKTITYAKVRPPVNEFYPFGLITGQVRPGAEFGTYGPYPGAGDLHFEFEDYGMSTARKVPPKYQGFQLTKVGKALTDYVSDLQGFDYRVDVDYDEDTNTFSKKFVFVSNEFPDPPAPGELSPISRFGADKYVFEHPGNISKYSLDRNASDAATRMFMVGRNPWGTEKPAPTSAAVAADMLQEQWPLLDADAKNASTYDHTVLYGYSRRDLSESRPPKADIKISVNGSLEPEVGTYAPGDWCSIIINDDPYMKQWMESDQEPRDTVVLRRIDGFKVKVPDGVAFPEIVELDLTPQWEVDRLGD